MNVETPGTLGETIAAMGKNPAKIRNLKVTGTVNADDFYFMRDNMDILEAVNMKECSPASSVSFDAWSDWESYVPYHGEPTSVDGNREYQTSLIPGNAFRDKKSLTKFVFPEDVSQIGYGAFINTNLSGAIILPESVKIIGDAAFYGTLIGNISFSSNLKKIVTEAFYGCTGLTNITIPENVNVIGYVPVLLLTDIGYTYLSSGTNLADPLLSSFCS